MGIDQAGRAERLRRVKDVMVNEGVDLLLVTPSADLQYLAQLGTQPSERPTIFAVQANDGEVLVVPKFEAPLASHLKDIPIIPYEDTQDPYTMLANALGVRTRERQIALSDRTWSAFLLRLQAGFPGASFRPASPLIRRLRMIKSGDELDLLARAATMADAGFERIVRRPFAGRTERDVASELSDLLSKAGLKTSDWGPIVASGPNAASPHHLTGDREIREGDAVVLDFGGSLDGYQADMTRTVHVGTSSDEFRRVYDIVRRAQQVGVDTVHPGTPAEDVDHAVRGGIQVAGYGPLFPHRAGHGIGLDVHEDPYIVSGNGLTLESGMTFSVEPGIYVEGRFGVRIEDIVRVTEQASQRLNNATRDPISVG